MAWSMLGVQPKKQSGRPWPEARRASHQRPFDPPPGSRNRGFSHASDRSPGRPDRWTNHRETGDQEDRADEDHRDEHSGLEGRVNSCLGRASSSKPSMCTKAGVVPYPGYVVAV